MAAVFLRKNWLAVYATTLLMAGLYHLLMGAPIVSVSCAVAGALVALVPAALFGGADMIAIFSLLAGFRYCSSALFLKLVYLEPLDQGLYNSDLSFTVTLAGMMCLVSSGLLAHLLWQRKPVFEENYAVAGLEFLRVIAIILSLAALFLVFAHRETLGGIAALVGKGYALLPIAWGACNLATGRPVLSRPLLVCLGMLSLALIATNSRLGVVLPIMGLVFFILSFRVKISRKAIVICMGLMVFYALVVAPIMSVVRYGREQTSPIAMITKTISAVGASQSFEILNLAQRLSALQRGGYNLRYTETSNNFLQRAVAIEELDIVVAWAAKYKPIGTERFWNGLPQLLPSFLVSDRSIVLQPSWALWSYGLIPWGQEFDPETTTFGEAYTYGGIPFVIGSAFCVYLIIFLIFRIFCPSFSRSPMAVFLIVNYGHVFTISAVLQMLVFIFRELPFEILLFYCATRIMRPIFSISPTSSRPA